MEKTTEKTFTKKQMTAVGFVIAIVTAAVMIILQMFGVTTASKKIEKEEVKPVVEKQVVEKTVETAVKK